MKEKNEKIFKDEILPELEKISYHIRPGRWEDREDIQQELIACAIKLIDWVERKDEVITHPKAIPQRVARYIISGRRAFSQKRTDALHTHREDGRIVEYEGYRTTDPMSSRTSKVVQRTCDLEEIYRMLGKQNSEILDMMIRGYSNGQIAETFNMSQPKCSEVKKRIKKTIKDWLDQDMLRKTTNKEGVVTGIAEDTRNKPAPEDISFTEDDELFSNISV